MDVEIIETNSTKAAKHSNYFTVASKEVSGAKFFHTGNAHTSFKS